MQTKTFTIYDQENQAVRDAYAMLTTNIHLGSEHKEIKTLVFSSCKPKTGKTSIAISLATTMAMWGKKTLLVDGDMRKPAKAKRLSGAVSIGLSDYIQGFADLNEVVCKTNIDNLNYVSCGEYTPNPMSLLCSDKFDNFLNNVKNEFDFVVFDTPALSSVVDASLIAAKTDATILVAKIGQTNLVTLRRAKEQLEKVKANIMGIVLNKVDKGDYKRYFSSYNYFFNKKKFINNRKVKSELAKQIKVNA